jgi:hypothetical protein
MTDTAPAFPLAAPDFTAGPSPYAGHVPGPYTLQDTGRSPERITAPSAPGVALALVYLTDPDTRRRSPAHAATARLFTDAPMILAQRDALAAQVAALQAALAAVLPLAESRAEDLDYHRSNGNEDPDYPGSAEALYACQVAAALLPPTA